MPLVAPTPLQVIVSLDGFDPVLYVLVIVAEAPGASEVGTPISATFGTSPHVMPLIVSLPVLVSVAVNETSNCCVAWLNTIVQTFGTSIDEAVTALQLAFAVWILAEMALLAPGTRSDRST